MIELIDRSERSQRLWHKRRWRKRRWRKRWGELLAGCAEQPRWAERSPHGASAAIELNYQADLSRIAIAAALAQAALAQAALAHALGRERPMTVVLELWSGTRSLRCW